MTEPRERLNAAQKKRSTINAEVQKIQGKLESAEADLTKVEDECRQFGVPPENIDAVLVQLEEKFDTSMGQLESDLAASESALEPFTRNETP